MTKTIKRRRIEGKTDYKARLAMLKSNKPRLVVRKTNQYIIAQIIETNVAQDKVTFGITSKNLIEKGWVAQNKGSLKSLAASYLTGFYLGNKAKGKIKEAILDMGMNRNIHKSRIFAVLKGFVDSGIKVPHDPESLPTLELIKSNEKTSKLFDKVKQSL